MTTFKELGLSDKALAAVKRMGYETPTPVQEKAIPLVLKRRDIVAGAQTGTGKTAAFSLPAMDKLGHAKGGQGPLMLVVTPTRELAQQIGEVAEQIAVSTHHRITTVVGGLSYRPQIERLSRGTDILIATPGRLIDLMDQKAVRLADVQVLVLDEADRMLDMGFLPSVKQIVAATPKSRQTLLFSATIDRSVLDVVGKMLRDPATVEISRKGDVADTVDHYVIRVPQSVKPDLLKALLAEKGFFRVIVFARTRGRADTACKRLCRAGYKAETIHSNRSQNQRKRSLDRFAKGEVNIITATDVLARGIDVDQVDYVVNYDVPDQPEDYIHRIGRTGRAGAKGLAVTFVTPETEKPLRDIEKLIGQEIPEMQLESFDMSAAEAESASKAINAQARRDPEVNRVKRDLANKAQKKARQKDEPDFKQAKRRKSGSLETIGKKNHAGKKQKQKPGKGQKRPTHGKTQAPREKGQSARARSQQNGRKQRGQAKQDFRPGRARRAEMQSRQSRKKR